MVDWDKQAVIEGIVVDIQPITLKPEKKGAKPKTTRILTLDTKNGHMGIWEKVQLKTLFDSVEKGSSVWIAHLGTKKIPGRPLPMHEFSVAMK